MTDNSTLYVPTTFAAAVHVMDVAEDNVTAHAVPSIVTVFSALVAPKFVPAKTMLVPADPVVGVTVVMTGVDSALYVKSCCVYVCPLEVTATLTPAAAWLGVSHTTCDRVTEDVGHAAPSTVTVVDPFTKPLPEIVSDVPPLVLPSIGDIPDMTASPITVALPEARPNSLMVATIELLPAGTLLMVHSISVLLTDVVEQVSPPTVKVTSELVVEDPNFDPANVRVVLAPVKDVGVTELILGVTVLSNTNWQRIEQVAGENDPLGVLTLTSSALSPLPVALVTMTICVYETLTISTLYPPIVTWISLTPPWKPVPFRTTLVPPEVDPRDGEISLTKGASPNDRDVLLAIGMSEFPRLCRR